MTVHPPSATGGRGDLLSPAVEFQVEGVAPACTPRTVDAPGGGGMSTVAVTRLIEAHAVDVWRLLTDLPDRAGRHLAGLALAAEQPTGAVEAA